ncbi:MAG: hypothetical protein KatS3mg111_0214 [Pirellulaceae bacterium]|nr:MAG: hypothetical protein KatS3mg111_0214 [Pirellulaceae bacterium]
MKRMVIIGLSLALLTGCGRGWLPLYRGAPCRGCGLLPNPLLRQPASCAPCNEAQVGYESYPGEVVGGEYIEGELPPGDYYGGIVTEAPGTQELAPLPAPANN